MADLQVEFLVTLKVWNMYTENMEQVARTHPLSVADVLVALAMAGSL